MFGGGLVMSTALSRLSSENVTGWNWGQKSLEMMLTHRIVVVSSFFFQIIM